MRLCDHVCVTKVVRSLFVSISLPLSFFLCVCVCVCVCVCLHMRLCDCVCIIKVVRSFFVSFFSLSLSVLMLQTTHLVTSFVFCDTLSSLKH